MARVSVVVVTTSNANGLPRALACARTEPDCAELIVVLNAATDAVRTIVADEPDLLVVESETSLGLAGGFNAGAERATGDHVLCLHDDAEGSPGFLSALVAALAGDPGTGAAGPLGFETDGRLREAGRFIDRDAATMAWRPDRVPDAPYRVDYCGSFCLLITRAALEATGGFDERFHPSFFVDVDFSMALRARGLSVLCVPAARVVHPGGTSTTRALQVLAGARNRERLRDKWAVVLAEQPADAADGPAAAAHRQLQPWSDPPFQNEAGGSRTTRVARYEHAYRAVLEDRICELEDVLGRVEADAAFWRDASRRHEEASAFYQAANQRHEEHIRALEARLAGQ